MPYNDAFTKMVGDTSATFKTEITALQDNVTEELGAPVLEGGKYKAKGDLNEIIQEIVNNDVLLKAIADKLRVDLDSHSNNKNNPHAVTKTQVGLGSVANFPITSSVSDSSNSKYATAGAVKVANDNADTRIPKAGGSFTGLVDFNKGFQTSQQIGVGITPATKEFPNANKNDVNNYLTDYIAIHKCNNNALTIFGQNAHNARRMAIQSSHSDTSFANVPGILELNPYGGDVRINGSRAYCENYKPSKADIGLSNVSNLPITSSVSDPSNEKYATAGAVKAVQDNANGRVSKTGDTMTGALKVNRSVNPEGDVSIIPYETYSGGALFASTRYTWYKDRWDIGARRGTSIDIASFAFYLNDALKMSLDIYGNLFVVDGTKKVFNQSNILEAFNQNLDGSSLGTNSKNIIGAINENSPSKGDQVFSSHYFHRLHGADATGVTKVYEHIYGTGGVGQQNIPTGKVVRCADGSGNMIKFEMLGNEGGRMAIQDKIVYDQRLIGNATLLYESGTPIQNATITLGDALTNYEKIIIVVSNRVDGYDVDLNNFVYNTSTLRYNDSATADNASNDYSIAYQNGYGWKGIYFRSNGKNIYIGEGIRPTGQSNHICTIRYVWGINKKNGGI